MAEGKMANAAPSAANSSAVAEAIVAPHIDAEATFAPPGNSVFVRITPAAAPDAQIEVEGGRKVADGLYAMEGNRMTIRMRYRSGGREQTLERTIVRADARTWEQTSQQTKDAVSKAKNPPE
ncbi:MAG TPA: hypothetical protein VKH35_09905 [Thermoanaerobaculia bacterium]|nr:hypothetical protein [Thermoanaerobaculia bacterium]